MAKRGMFGGSRFGYTSFGKSGFKRGFGRASFGRNSGQYGYGIAEDMMQMFQKMQGLGIKFSIQTSQQVQVTQTKKPKKKTVPPVPAESAGTYTPPTNISNPYWDSPTSNLPPVGNTMSTSSFRVRMRRKK